MKCKTCNKDHHFCWNCGIEEYYYDYCSEKCLDEAGYKVCPVCHGYGILYHEEAEDLYCDGYVPKDGA